MSRFVACLVAGEPPRLVADPPAAEVEGCSVLFRGYLANRAALDALARGRGHPRAPASDAERLALAYRWWGADLPRHVLGEYAAAVYDAPRRTLLLAHDELGLRPLFYAASGGALHFGARLEELVAETGVGELDEEYLADYLARGEHSGERTPYAAIRRLRPGESVVWRDGRLSRRSTWTLPEVQPLRCRDPGEYAARVRQCVEEAVAGALPAGGGAWCELSGGLDSSTVLCVAARLGAPGLRAVSLVYPRSHTADERGWIRRVLDENPVPWHPVDADAVRPFTEEPRGFHAEPSAWMSFGGVLHATADLFREHGVDVVLTGQGGDAVFHGDLPEPYFLADLLRRGRPAEAWRHARAWGAASYERRPPAHFLARYGLRPLWRRLRGEGPHPSTVEIPWADGRWAGRVGLRRRGRGALPLELPSVAQTYHAQRVLRTAASVAVHHSPAHAGPEYRNPLLYRPLVELMLAVPPEHACRAGADRVLQRLAMRGVLPERTLRRTGKRGPDQAFYEGLESADDWIAMLTSRPRIVERGYADASRWREAVQQARFGRTVGIRYFLASVNVETWLRRLERFSGRPRLALETAAEATVHA